MPCPKCGSNDLWDDQLAWGCNRCRWFTGGSTVNTSAYYDRFNGEPSPYEMELARRRRGERSPEPADEE